MNDMKFRLGVNCLIAAYLFGMWQNSYQAGCFMFVLLGFILSAIDYAKEKSSK